MTTAYVALGSNLQDPSKQVQTALDALSQKFTVLAQSSFYHSEPVGGVDQPTFVNAVVALSVTLPPQPLLAQLLALEAKQGRERNGQRWGPRIIDLDLLLYGCQCLATPELQVPHPRMHLRAFVLEPLFEIAPSLILPSGESVAALLEKVREDSPSVVRIIA